MATKFGLPMGGAGALRGGASRRYIVQAVEASLRRLKTDWIDLYQLHRADPKTPIEETLRALDDLVKAGKIRFIGCSNLSAAQLEQAQAVSAAHGLSSFVTCQDEYNLLDRGIEKDRVAVMRKHGLGLLPYFPLASGLLTGKYKSDAPMPAGSRLATSAHHADGLLNAHNWRIVENLRAFAAQRGHSLLDLAMSWLACRPFISMHHCRRHQAGTGRSESSRCRLGFVAVGDRRDRPHDRLNWLAVSACEIRDVRFTRPKPLSISLPSHAAFRAAFRP